MTRVEVMRGWDARMSESEVLGRFFWPAELVEVSSRQ
jgi:hypothetical protein